jgi:hypothetical protein
MRRVVGGELHRMVNVRCEKRAGNADSKLSAFGLPSGFWGPFYPQSNAGITEAGKTGGLQNMREMGLTKASK